ncbi:MAG TPA: type VI secretion system baseplate subunit TssG [Pyrinomonadaceae bacterium]|jgi:type VI secretion system protein ImpH
MGDYGWGKDKKSVIAWLFAEGYRFDFFQAVRLLETLYSWEQTKREEAEARRLATADGQTATAHPSYAYEKAEAPKDFVRFKSAVELSFPTSDISDVRLKDSGANGGGKSKDKPTTDMIVERVRQGNVTVAEMTVNLMGLAGALGPLDMPTTELIIERAANYDTALRDFLDIFNHRLISLLYRIRKMHRIGLEHEPPGQDQISRYLFSVIGMNTDGLLGRMQIRDRSLLHYAGLLGLEQRSLVGLEIILADYFKIRVKGRQFAGQWYELDETQWTKIGVSGQNRTLGEEAVVLGTHVWDEQAKIELHLGPLTLQQFHEFIPTGWRFRALCDLTRFYLGDTLDVSFRLTLKGTQIPAMTLSSTDGPRLGWTSWLKAGRDDSQAETDPNVPGPPFKSARLPLFFRLPAAQLAELIGLMKVRSYSKSEEITHQGQTGRSMFAIRRGSVGLIRTTGEREEKSYTFLGPGDCFGEMTLLLGRDREATAIALEDCEILELDKKEFDQFSARNKEGRDAPRDDSQVEIKLSIQPSEFKSARLPLFFHLPPTQLAELIGLMKKLKFKNPHDDSRADIKLSAPRSESTFARAPLYFRPSTERLAKLIDLMEKLTYRKSPVIMQQGRTGRSMFAIRRGRVELSRREDNGKITKLGTLGPGECFGEMTLLYGKDREATAIALEDCEILELDKKEFDQFSAQEQNRQWRKALKAYRFGQLVKPREPNRKFLV